MTAKGFLMHRRKTTDYTVCYRDIMDRIGNVYLPKPVVERMGLGDEITVQLAREKNEFGPGGYVTVMHPYKNTPKKVRFKESTWEQGVLGVIYVAKKVLKDMGLKGDIAVQITASMEEATGGGKLARSST